MTKKLKEDLSISAPVNATGQSVALFDPLLEPSEKSEKKPGKKKLREILKRFAIS